MDCCICSALPYILRPPRNTICGACYEGARSIITLTNKFDNEKGSDNKTSNHSASSANSAKGFANALKWVKEMKEMEEVQNEKIGYLSGFGAAFSDQIHTDIEVKPGNNEPSIPAHRALLAARSSIFRNTLESDKCKAPPNQTITLPELNHDELQSLLEFLYFGNLPKEKVEKHVYSLSIAADKYEIPFLQKFCEHQMLGSLSTFNALDILEISDTCSNQSLKETALSFIVRNMEDVVFSARFDAFALKNPHLTVQITRASFMDIRNKRTGV
ncbi:BTB/POZ domain-containing protein at3g56230 [Phtheirospermum japonicum]|uniref:BTB/POZ domain-containing protein at3g56230 n=1 Tax=Phtheirospermum japonicum TaxID=374723 RepID=A0A830CWG1_9LAMI|nr:BTB/POZ domain-containing protein at3g56230 [Phtheirospermum japonicum]